MKLETYQHKPTQEVRILKILQEARGNWVDGMTFLRLNPPITQYHARIWGLQKKGYIIEGRFISDKNWKEYRLLKPLEVKPLKSIVFQQTKMFQNA